MSIFSTTTSTIAADAAVVDADVADVAVVEVVAIGVSGNTVGPMGYKLIVEENAKHQCKGIKRRLPWRTVWAVTAREYILDGVGL